MTLHYKLKRLVNEQQYATTCIIINIFNSLISTLQTLGNHNTLYLLQLIVPLCTVDQNEQCPSLMLPV